MHNWEKTRPGQPCGKRGTRQFPAQINVPLRLFFSTGERARITNDYNIKSPAAGRYYQRAGSHQRSCSERYSRQRTSLMSVCYRYHQPWDLILNNALRECVLTNLLFNQIICAWFLRQPILQKKSLESIIIQNVTDLGLTSKSIETLPSIKIKVPMGLRVSILGKPAMS